MSDDWRDTLKSLLPDPAASSDKSDPSDMSDKSSPSPEKPHKLPTLRVAVERKGRAGKTATIVYGFPDDYPEAEIDSLASQLRRSLGTGGSARGGEILLQGDRAAAVVDALKALGYKSHLC